MPVEIADDLWTVLPKAHDDQEEDDYKFRVTEAASPFISLQIPLLLGCGDAPIRNAEKHKSGLRLSSAQV